MKSPRSMLEILRSIVADVKAMQCDMPDEMEKIGPDDAEEDKHWLGTFSAGWADSDGTYSVQWPNLAILVEEAERAIAQELGQGTSGKSKRVKKIAKDPFIYAMPNSYPTHEWRKDMAQHIKNEMAYEAEQKKKGT